MHKGLGIFLGTAALAFAIASAEAKTQLRVVVAYYSAATQGIFEGMAKDFSTAHPDAEVKVEVVQWDNLEQRLTNWNSCFHPVFGDGILRRPGLVALRNLRSGKD
jgi:ABC-type glycerol-3-phosphate transport system substrate-binding protein